MAMNEPIRGGILHPAQFVPRCHFPLSKDVIVEESEGNAVVQEELMNYEREESCLR